MVPSSQARKNALHELGYKIFLDRYAQKDMTRATLAVGDTVIVVVNSTTGQREVGKVTALSLPKVTIELLDGEIVTRDVEHVDKPLETDPAQMMDRVAAGIAGVETTPETQREWTEKFRWLLDDWKFVPGGRILAGAGTPYELTFFNCFVLSPIHDSRGGIFERLQQMAEIMSRGGGVGINVSTLRPRFAYVKGVNGRSSGAVSWAALYSYVTGLIEQAGSRRGALMVIMNDWHPDVFEFINSKREAGHITNANISVNVSDALMEAVKADGDWPLLFPDTSDPEYDTAWDGDIDAWRSAGKKVNVYRTVKARELWNAITESAWASAEPGVWFGDRSNKMSNSYYYPHGKLIATNPCVTGDTRIYTNHGLVKAIELFDQETDIEVAIDGRFGLARSTTPSTRVFMTGRKPVFRLQTKEGYFVRATEDHRFMTPKGWVELRDLNPGDQVHVLNRKGGFGQEGSLELGRVLGWLVGDGTIKADRAVLSFFGDEKRELAPVFADHVNTLVAPMTTRTRVYNVGVVEVTGRDEARVQSERLLRLAEEYGMVGNKHHVPEKVFQGSEDMQRGFLQALFTADGGIQWSSGSAHVRLASSEAELLEEVQMLLANFGIACRIYRNRRVGNYRKLPDGKGGTKEYWCKAQHEIDISKQNINVFAQEIGFILERKQEALLGSIARYSEGLRPEWFVATVDAITEDGVEEVYDLTEPVSHSFVSNGLVIHNCGEQPLPGFGICNLGALNLARFAKGNEVDWESLGMAVRYGVRFLDNVIDATPYFFEANYEQQMLERRVGLGIMGLAELMIRCQVRYGSDESVDFLDRLFGFIASEAYLASADNAREKGAFPAFDAEKYLASGYMQQMPEHVREAIRENGSRNVTLLTVAPTGTTGTMVNTSTGVEPFFSWVYYRKSRLGLHEEQVPLVRDFYAENPSAKELPEYFVAAMDLTPKEHVRVQAAIQRWVDSAISKTSNLPNSYTVEQVSELYQYMYELGCKGGTVYRDGSRDEQVLMLKVEEPAEDKKPEAAAVEAPKPAPAKAEKAERYEQVATPHRVYPRPKKLQGVTVNCPTPFGTAYITMNSDEHGYPFEVFITAPGKAGSDLQADAEGLGRMISLSLRTTDPHNRLEMLKLIIDQLRDIGGARSVGFGQQRVISLPDAVARAMEDNYFPKHEPMQLGLPMNGLMNGASNGAAKALPAQTITEIVEEPGDDTHDHFVQETIISGADMCPSCGTISLVRAEGCRKCLTCGYSEC
ncbi:MAG: LAGLIDADG family homing endonuclease [bacterium]|nr:LAGLIDADG family homing endonuclease [bacterium]